MITGKIINVKGADVAMDKVSWRRAQFFGDAARTARFIRESIEQHLSLLLGEDMKYFKVHLYGNQYGYFIKVNTVPNQEGTDIGSFMFYGTKAHNIGSPGQHLLNPSTGSGSHSPASGAFAATGVVPHPGQPDREKEILAEIKKATKVAFLWASRQ